MLNSISTSKPGAAAVRRAVPANESDPGLAKIFGNLLAELGSPSESAPATNTPSTIPANGPKTRKQAPISTTLHSDLASLLALPMPDTNPLLRGGVARSAGEVSGTPAAPVAKPLPPIDFAAFDVKSIDVQVESSAAVPPQLSMKQGFESKLLAELQQAVVKGGQTVNPPPIALPDGTPEKVDRPLVPALSLPPAQDDSSTPSSGALPDVLLAADPRDASSALQKPLPGIQSVDSLTAVGPSPIVATIESNAHGASHQESGTEHEKHSGEPLSSNEISNVSVPSNTPASFGNQIAGAEASHPVAHVQELPVAPESLKAHRVSIDIGENESRVTVTLHERGGDVSVKIHSASEPLSTQLQSSVGSLVEALHREHVSLKNMDFTSGFANQGNPQGSQPKAPRPRKLATPVAATDDVEFSGSETAINFNA